MIKNPQNDIDYLSVSATMRNKKGEKLIIMIIIASTAATTHLTEMQYGLTLKTDSISHLLPPLVFASLSKVVLTSLHVLQEFLKRCCAVLRVPWWNKETNKLTNFRAG
jgi:hypothetical protein